MRVLGSSPKIWLWKSCSPPSSFGSVQAVREAPAAELEARLSRIAAQTGKGPEDVVRELVANYLDHDEWFRQEVEKGLASLDRAQLVSHEEVRRQLGRILGSQ